MLHSLGYARPLRAALGAVLTMALAACGVGDLRDDPADTSAGPTAAASSFDPLAFREPRMPPVDGVATRADAAQALDFLAAAWTYGLRTTLTGPFYDICGDRAGTCDDIEQELTDLAAAQQHVETDPVRITLVRQLGRQRLNRYGNGEVDTQTAWVIDLEVPEQRVLDASGEEVRTEPADSRRMAIELIATTWKDKWIVVWWDDPTSRASA